MMPRLGTLFLSVLPLAACMLIVLAIFWGLAWLAGDAIDHALDEMEQIPIERCEPHRSFDHYCIRSLEDERTMNYLRK